MNAQKGEVRCTKSVAEDRLVEISIKDEYDITPVLLQEKGSKNKHARIPSASRI